MTVQLSSGGEFCYSALCAQCSNRNTACSAREEKKKTNEKKEKKKKKKPNKHVKNKRSS